MATGVAVFAVFADLVRRGSPETVAAFAGLAGLAERLPARDRSAGVVVPMDGGSAFAVFAGISERAGRPERAGDWAIAGLGARDGRGAFKRFADAVDFVEAAGVTEAAAGIAVFAAFSRVTDRAGR